MHRVDPCDLPQGYAQATSVEKRPSRHIYTDLSRMSTSKQEALLHGDCQSQLQLLVNKYHVGVVMLPRGNKGEKRREQEGENF